MEHVSNKKTKWNEKRFKKWKKIWGISELTICKLPTLPLRNNHFLKFIFLKIFRIEKEEIS